MRAEAPGMGRVGRLLLGKGLCEALLLVAGLGVLTWVQAEPVEIKMPTPKGFVAFTVEGQWPVLALQTRYPVASVAYRIPHPADADTPDAGNIAIAFYDVTSHAGRSAFAAPPKQYGATAPVVETRGGWTMYRQVGQQGDTPYTVVDAKRTKLAGVSVSVRMVWPRRGGDSVDFEASMDRVLQDVLQSVHAGVHTPRR